MEFSEIAKEYEKISKVQNSASNLLFKLLKIRRDDNVLDLGCRTGKLTRKLREMTDGKVVGVDLSAEMIYEARRKSKGLEIQYEVKAAEEIDYREDFDIIVCNSAFRWFEKPEKALINCFRALKPGGKMGVQAPATKEYCPAFISALKALERDRYLSDILRHFKSPWFFLDHEYQYCRFFEKAGFQIQFCRILKVESLHKPEGMFEIFLSGAAAAYLN